MRCLLVRAIVDEEVLKAPFSASVYLSATVITKCSSRLVKRSCWLDRLEPASPLLKKNIAELAQSHNLSFPLHQFRISKMSAKNFRIDSAEDSLPKTLNQLKCADFFALSGDLVAWHAAWICIGYFCRRPNERVQPPSFAFSRLAKKQCAKLLLRRIHFLL